MKRLITILCLLLPCAAIAEPPPVPRFPGGSVEAVVDGRKVLFPSLKTDIDAQVDGDLATVTVTQLFQNPVTTPVNATYLFPLQQDSAVYRMTMEVGDEIVEAQIQKIEEARATFEKAKSEGKAAALLTQHRPNMFTQEVANLMPGMPVKVTIHYMQVVPKVDGAYELVVPLVVGPRYQTAGSGTPPLPREQISSKAAFGRWEVEQLPAYPQEVAGLTLPETIDADRASIQVHLRAGLPLGTITSTTHGVEVEKEGAERRIVRLSKGRVLANRDFVLRYTLGGLASQTEAGLLAHKDARGGFFSLMIEPPALPDAKDILPREMVFVLDTSGSMDGMPVEASKTFMRQALAGMRPQDYFRIIRFSNNASEFTTGPVPATIENIRAGLAYVNGLSADGGTEIATAVDQAFLVPQQPGTLRMVVFLTDGYIGNEMEILTKLRKDIGAARIFALGVGTSVNRYLLDEMALAGRGFARYIDPTDKSQDAAMQLAAKLETPVLSDISIDWGEIAPSDVTPSVLPDLFAGGNIRVQGRYAHPGTYHVTVSGLVNGREARMPLTVHLPAASDSASDAIPLIWARTRIGEYMRMLSAPVQTREGGITDDTIKNAVTKLGLDFALATRWTSFVAVSRKIVNTRPQDAADANVPLHQVEGVGEKAYGIDGSGQPGQPVSLVTAQNFAGSATPEPAAILGLLVLALMGYGALYRKERQV